MYKTPEQAMEAVDRAYESQHFAERLPDALRSLSGTKPFNASAFQWGKRTHAIGLVFKAIETAHRQIPPAATFPIVNNEGNYSTKLARYGEHSRLTVTKESAQEPELEAVRTKIGRREGVIMMLPGDETYQVTRRHLHFGFKVARVK